MKSNMHISAISNASGGFSLISTINNNNKLLNAMTLLFVKYLRTTNIVHSVILFLASIAFMFSYTDTHTAITFHTNK